MVADDSVCEDIIRYAEDKKFGRSREMLALALIGMKSPKVDDVLIKLLDDDDVVGHALIAIGKRRVEQARDRVELLKSHPKAWIRKEAKKALSKMTI